MKSVFASRPVLAAACTALLWTFAGTACVSTSGTGPGAGSYIVTLHDGQVYRSSERPVLNPKTGYYKFRDRYGRDRVLRDTEVAKIESDTG